MLGRHGVAIYGPPHQRGAGCGPISSGYGQPRIKYPGGDERMPRLETVLRIAWSLEAIHEEERHHSHGRKPSSQARFMSNERTRSQGTGERSIGAARSRVMAP